jgi:pseudaminic acid synthase
LTPDGFFSIEPAELKELIHDIRITEKALGKPCYGATKGEKKSLLHRRSLFTVNNITKGELFTEENVRSIRPANGIKPKYMKEILGKRAKRNIKKGTPLSWGLVS